jgi:hypothetical protein
MRHGTVSGRRSPAQKWDGYPNLRKRPPTPSKGRGPVQVRIRRAFMASGAEVLSTSAIYAWTHARRRHRHHKSMPLASDTSDDVRSGRARSDDRPSLAVASAQH